ncbi:hypothetical protein B0H66DRAFT_570162 [Apodospora peruviana]|uniref:NACHT domain-containing protein n=1 Tax=Apodospora peruviana TaxID=516989 RepID=A0AAE0HSP4_9PEZI|nr:hypothetical protein B0H66DRAFT_570162 [Apodospora peruviana]
MDPLSALAVAAAVVQFADFAGRLLVKSWDRGKRGNDRAAEVQNVAQQLSDLTTALHDAMDSLPSGGGEMSAQARLQRACSACDSIASEFQELFGLATESRLADGHISPFLACRRLDAREISRLQEKLFDTKQMATETVLLCLWDEAKKAEARDRSFGAQLKDVVDILRRIDEKARDNPVAAPTETNLDADASALISELRSDGKLLGNYGGNSDSSRAAALRMLAQAGKGYKLLDVSDDIHTTLSSRSNDMGGTGVQRLRHEILETVQDESWQPDDSIYEVPDGHGSPTIYFREMAHRSGLKHLHFDGSQARESAVSDTILQTYSWIYDRHPQAPGGTDSVGHLWSSFPEWLEGPSDTTYWITGKPGSGKSTIMKHILQSPALKTHLGRWAGGTPLVVVSYYAWNAGTTLQKSFQGLKMTLLFQVLTQHPALLPYLFPRRLVYVKLVNPIHPFREFEDSEIEEAFNNLLYISSPDKGKVALAVFVDGLDEFSAPPKDVVAMVESITSASGNGVKVCVASRPWVEFDDAYCDAPKLQMELYTRPDMTTYVAERFRKCRAFEDLKRAYPAETARLLSDIAVKANGVFIWLRVVVDSLVESATEGAGIRGLEDIVQSLPSDMGSLYDAIWARIPEHSQKRGALLLWLMEVCSMIDTRLYSVPGWLADEYAFRSYDVTKERLDPVGNSRPFEHIRVSLRRKLASRTRGLLELVRLEEQDGSSFEWVVTYTHRTASEWATLRHQEIIRDKIIQHYADLFDPHLFLFEMFTMQMTSAELCPTTPEGLWSFIIGPALHCAARVSEKSPRTVQTLVVTLRAFDKAAGLFLDYENPESLTHRPSMVAVDAPGQKGDRPPHLSHWSGLSFHDNSAGDYGVDDGRDKTFMNLACQFAILPYIKTEAALNPDSILSQPGTRHSLGILECAIFGHRMYRSGPAGHSVSYFEHDGDLLPIRLELVRFLLESGVEQSDMYVSKRATPGFETFQVGGDFPPDLAGDTVSIKRILMSAIARARAIDSLVSAQTYAEYFTDVAALMDRHSSSSSSGGARRIVRTALKSTSKWFKSSRSAVSTSQWKPGKIERV